jgi:hypothetical protein
LWNEKGFKISPEYPQPPKGGLDTNVIFKVPLGGFRGKKVRGLLKFNII